MPLLTHDVLVTSGDYADEGKVEVGFRIVGGKHGFYWKSGSKPHGRINLIHAIPANTSIYDSLDEIEYGSRVSIKGFEVAVLTNLESGRYWSDMGCNTLYVTRVGITAPQGL
ncbi:MAG: hypothetical protein U9M95_01940 [Candidatus Altiarchaeota archaeon]|nr:hypothetical protein [Candidatus Altiarchaeota archaeon]